MSGGSINDLIDAWEGEGILWANFIEVLEVDTKVSGFILLWYHHQVF